MKVNGLMSHELDITPAKVWTKGRNMAPYLDEQKKTSVQSDKSRKRKVIEEKNCRSQKKSLLLDNTKNDEYKFMLNELNKKKDASLFVISKASLLGLPKQQKEQFIIEY